MPRKKPRADQRVRIRIDDDVVRLLITTAAKENRTAAQQLNHTLRRALLFQPKAK